MQKTITVASFSPAGTTRRAALFLAEGLAEQVRELDLAAPGGVEPRSFAEDDLVLFAAPVYGGRIPAFLRERLKACSGSRTRAVTAVVYGNRAYEDALLELNDCLHQQGFRIPASAALLAEHSIVRSVAAGRPDKEDQRQLQAFAEAVRSKLEQTDCPEAEVPGSRPYKDWTPMQAVPTVSSACARCARCAEQCPAQAIPAGHPESTDPAKCMLCMRCVSRCPARARALPAPLYAMLEEKLSPLRSIRRENELFL